MPDSVLMTCRCVSSYLLHGRVRQQPCASVSQICVPGTGQGLAGDPLLLVLGLRLPSTQLWAGSGVQDASDEQSMPAIHAALFFKPPTSTAGELRAMAPGKLGVTCLPTHP